MRERKVLKPLEHDPAAVRRAREDAGLTQRDLARRVGISDSFLSEVESGRANANPAMIGRLAEALRCPPVVLEARREDATSEVHMLMRLVAKYPVVAAHEVARVMAAWPDGLPGVDGDALYYVRKRAGLTLDELAAACGVTGSIVGEIETGMRPGPELLDKLAQALNCPPSMLAAKRLPHRPEWLES